MVLCQRRGCGAELSSSSGGACFFHPGAPVFHEGLKSWSCCNETPAGRPQLEFDAFMQIKGCAEAPSHTTEKQELPEGAKPIQTSAPAAEAGPSRASIPAAPVATASKAQQPTAPKPEEQDPEEAQVQAGAQCKRSGCKVAFEGGSRDRSKEQCRYHKGVAIFHEGSKVGPLACYSRGGR